MTLQVHVYNYYAAQCILYYTTWGIYRVLFKVQSPVKLGGIPGKTGAMQLYITTTRLEWPHCLTTCSRAAHYQTKTCTCTCTCIWTYVCTTLGLVVTVYVHVYKHSIDPCYYGTQSNVYMYALIVTNEMHNHWPTTPLIIDLPTTLW